MDAILYGTGLGNTGNNSCVWVSMPINRIPVVCGLCVLAAFGSARAQESAPPAGAVDERRLAVSTLIREDLFAGFLANDMRRFELGEKKLETLLQERPKAKAELLAWQGATLLYRAVLHFEKSQASEGDKLLAKATALFEEASALSPKGIAVLAIRGGMFAMLGDRLPEAHRPRAWQQLYTHYTALAAEQAAFFDKMPVHHRGEVLGGLALAAERMGKAEERDRHLERILNTLAGTPYARVAARWKENPEIASRTSTACQTCHEPGRLAAQRSGSSRTE